MGPLWFSFHSKIKWNKFITIEIGSPNKLEWNREVSNKNDKNNKRYWKSGTLFLCLFYYVSCPIPIIPIIIYKGLLGDPFFSGKKKLLVHAMNPKKNVIKLNPYSLRSTILCNLWIVRSSRDVCLHESQCYLMIPYTTCFTKECGCTNSHVCTRLSVCKREK
jgi:hypothetical protein